MIRGERFELNLDSDDETHVSAAASASVLPGAFVNDVLERKASTPKPPSLPSLKSNTGFPEHKKRNAPSKFKRQKSASAQTVAPTPSTSTLPTVSDATPASARDHASGKAKTWEEEEKERIDQENRQKLANMSLDEIEAERRELMNTLDPGLIQRLLGRSLVESGSEEVDLSAFVAHEESEHTEAQKDRLLDASVDNLARPVTKPTKTVTFGDTSDMTQTTEPTGDILHDEALPNESDADATLPHDTIHFPRPPQPPSLDPTSDTFLTDLHQKYFPSLPTDPSKLEWMQPPSPTTTAQSPYSPTATHLAPQDIRFDFAGHLLPPRLAASIPTTRGLHHHASAPSSAGYTLSELAHLSRSTYPAQRCIAFQTLGRILYRLSIGEFGLLPAAVNASLADVEILQGPSDGLGALARGLWGEVERLGVIGILVAESEGRGVDAGRHVSARCYATEAVWLWRKGGGRRFKAA